MRTKLLIVGLAVAVTAAACNTRPLPDAFIETTTTSTTLAGIDIETTTTVTLPPPEVQVTGTVTGVTDGDTIEVLLDGTTVDVRLLGINSPELSECWGEESMVELSSLIADKDVLLVEGPIDIDPFGRLLRYVYLETDEGPTFVNAALIETGHAIGLHQGSEYDISFKEIEARAFQSGRGMWATFACGDREGVKADRPVIRVSELVYDPAGPDTESLGGEFITIVNEGYDTVSIGGWTLRDESTSNRFVINGNTTLDPGESVTIVTGCEGGPPGSVHWCNDQAVWSNDGDTAIVLDTLGNAVVWYTYHGDQS
jgi:endonuclease YncB( thermonuclease family)